MATVSKQGQKVNLVSNQYLLKVGASVKVFQYALDIQPLQMWDVNLVHRIMKLKSYALERALGPHVCSGKSIYTLNQIDEDLFFNPTVKGTEYTIKININTATIFTLGGSFSNKDNDVKQQLINVIIKDAFRSTDLKQVGKTPRFFDT